MIWMYVRKTAHAYKTTQKPTGLNKLSLCLKGPIAALPVPYRTNENQVTFFSLTVPGTGLFTLLLNL